MRRGFEEIVRNARIEVEYALDSLEDFRNENETRKLWKAWAAILDHYVKAVAAMRRATDQGSSKVWSDNLLNEQRTDMFLIYGFQARAEANHIFESKRKFNERTVSLGNFIILSGNASVHLEGNRWVDESGNEGRIPDGTIRTNDGRYSGGTIPRELIEEKPHYLVVEKVENRSGTYSVPNLTTEPEHRALEIADYICNWLSARLTDLEELVEREKTQGRKKFDL